MLSRPRLSQSVSASAHTHTVSARGYPAWALLLAGVCGGQRPRPGTCLLSGVKADPSALCFLDTVWEQLT